MIRPKLLIATRNPGKMREYRGLLRDVPFQLVSLDDLGIPDEVEETGETFAENARLKAGSYARLSGMLTLSDDSGLEVDALNGDPGVRSARYGGDPGFSDQDRVSLLLHNLAEVAWEKRTARFRCFTAIFRPPELQDPPESREVTCMVGSVAGMIQYKPEGDEGFGYDPVFYLPSYRRTMAQLPLEEKNRISHRADAARRAVAVLNKLSAVSGQPSANC
ncbi:MAG: RdgB/HAM1 family non-canonical purine NTP pyrophosphatase [Chloroflexi bacterium]|nr:RdgB/HAM1 family non-canonical purine NTP pyrophosphatase [Chloroflexota bacterium]